MNLTLPPIEEQLKFDNSEWQHVAQYVDVNELSPFDSAAVLCYLSKFIVTGSSFRISGATLQTDGLFSVSVQLIF